MIGPSGVCKYIVNTRGSTIDPWGKQAYTHLQARQRRARSTEINQPRSSPLTPTSFLMRRFKLLLLTVPEAELTHVAGVYQHDPLAPSSPCTSPRTSCYGSILASLPPSLYRWPCTCLSFCCAVCVWRLHTVQAVTAGPFLCHVVFRCHSTLRQ